MSKKNCANCGRVFGCGVNSNDGCWCASLPQTFANPDPSLDCFCQKCLATRVVKSEPPKELQLVEGADYYFEDGLLVMTAAYHLKRGSCCGNRCRWCPFDPRYELGATNKG